jgi:hypothetical protein
MRVLFLQQRSYFDSIGVLYSQVEAEFCCTFSINIEKYLMSFDLVASCIDHDNDARYLMNLANNLNIPTVFFMDGVYDISNSSNNPHLKNINITLFHPFYYTNIFVVGTKFGEYLSDKHDIKYYNYLPKRACLDIRKNVSPPKKVLITTAVTPYFSTQEKQVLIHWFKSIVSILNGRKISYCFRIFDMDLYKCISDSKSENLINIPLTEIVSNVSCVICTPSTVIHSLTTYKINNLCINYRNESLLYDTDIVCCLYKDLSDSITQLTSSESVIEHNIPTTNIDLNSYDFTLDNISPYKGNKSFFRIYFSYTSVLRIIYNSLPISYRKNIKNFLSVTRIPFFNR